MKIFRIVTIMAVALVGVVMVSAREFTVGLLRYTVLTGGRTLEVSMGDLPEGVESVDTLIIPESVFDEETGKECVVTKIAESGFLNCPVNKFLSIPGTIEIIPEKAFYCAEFKNKHPNGIPYPWNPECDYELGELTVELNEGLKEIGNGAFSYNPNLKCINFPEGLEIIGVDAFLYAVGLKEAILPNSIKDIKSDAFNRTYSLSAIILPQNGLDEIIATLRQGIFACTKSLKYILIPGAYTKIPSYFLSWSGIQAVELEKGIAYLDEYCFSGTDLDEIYLPDGVKVIYHHAFNECKSLKKVRIPNSLRFIDYYAFWNCDEIEEIEYLTSDPAKLSKPYYPEDDGPAFNDNVYDNATLYILEKYREKYEAIEPWKNFKNIVGHASSVDNTEDKYFDDGRGEGCRIYDMTGRDVTGMSDLPSGIYISVGNNNVKKIIR